MNKQDRQLLLQDLCTRLPYDPFVKIGNNPNPFRISQRIKWIYSYGKVENTFDRVKLYLRPISSMTKNELDYLYQNYGHDTVSNCMQPEAFDYLNSIHIDYRGLIPKGLALEAQPDMYK